MKKIAIPVGIVLCSIAVASYAFGPGGKQCGEHQKGMHFMMAKYLELSEEQIEQIKLIKTVAREEAKVKMLEVLTPEQQEKFKSFKDDMKAFGEEHRGKHGGFFH